MSSTSENRQHPFTFDPVVVGHLECEAWAAYYRREWLRFLSSAVGMVRAAFGMRPDRTLRGAWYVLRANQLWAPHDNDPEAARRFMRRFYTLVIRSHGMTVDATRAAELEVQWWRVHRHHQGGGSESNDELIDCLNALYAYLYAADPPATRRVAELRVAAMDLSDSWVVAGRNRADPLLAAERRSLVDSYSALRDYLVDTRVTPPESD